LTKNNSVRYRSITVILSAVLLVVVVIYVFQQLASDTGVQPEIAKVQQSMDAANKLGSESSVPEITLPVEEPLTSVIAEDGTGVEEQLVEAQSATDEIPVVRDTERPRRTIEIITADKSTNPVKNENADNKVNTNRVPAATRETIKKPPAQLPQKAPSTVVAENKPTSNPSLSGINERPVRAEVKQDVSPTQTAMKTVSEPRQQAVAPKAQARDNISAIVSETQVPSLPATQTFASMAPPQLEKQISNNISDRELKDFIADFIRGYEAGDLALFMNLFAVDAQTPDQSNRQGIRKDYQELFLGTEKRQFIIDNLQWKKEDNNRATGEGGFKVIVQAPGETTLNTFNGKVTFQVQKGPQGIVIKRLEHAYGGGGQE